MSTILLTHGLSVRQVLNGFVASARGILFFSFSLSLSLHRPPSIIVLVARALETLLRRLFHSYHRRHRDEPRDLKERKNTINAGETAH